MCEQHLFAEGLTIRGGTDINGNSSESAEMRSIPGMEDQRHESRASRHDLQPKLARQLVAKAGRAHFGDGKSPGGNDENGSAKLHRFATYDKLCCALHLANFTV